MVPQLAQMIHILLRLPVGPHPIVHRRNQKHPRFGGEETGGEQIVGEAVRDPREKVGRRRRDDDRVCSLRERDVIECASCFEEVRVHRPTGECLERHRSDELGRGARHDDIDFGASRRQQAREPPGFVARDAPRDAKDDSTAGVRAHALITGRGAAGSRGTQLRRR
jgi:hypothetical protein